MIHHRRTHHARSRSRRGFTLVEMMLALAVTALLAAGVSTMLFSMTRGTGQSHDLRQLNKMRILLDGRLGDVVRSATRVLEATGASLTVWYGDRNADGLVNLSELAHIAWDESTGEITYYTGATGLSEADDTGYATNDDFAVVVAALIGDPDFPGQRWADTVTAFDVDWDPGAHSGRLVAIEVTLDDTAGQNQGLILATYSLRGQ